LIRLKKHIATLLVGLFIFPILFQSWHVAIYHANEFYTISHVVFSETTSNFLHAETKTISRTPKFCPIREYQFSIIDLARMAIFRPFIPFFVWHRNEPTHQQYHKQIFSVSSPRAPPVRIS
jgi:hypothetical protein